MGRSAEEVVDIEEARWGKDQMQVLSAPAGSAALFDDGNYGMFIHWGLYSSLAGKWDGKTYYGIGEWIMNPRVAGIPVEEYQKTAAQFNPAEFDAPAIARLAKSAGMKWIIITSKHHEGFAMFDSAHPFNIVDATPFKRDPMRELAEACRDFDLGFGFYYSHNQDWTAPGGTDGPTTNPDGSTATFDQYFREKCFPQVQEICENYGELKIGEKKKIMVEFAHPNTHKAFHIGHLRNIITGESIVRILENADYKVVRANYQGDVGMHIAKCLYAILKDHEQDVLGLASKPLADRIEFIGKVYAEGAQAFEKDEEVKKEVGDLNTKIYEQDESIREIYTLTRDWSLEYFENIYARVGSHFDRLYFESEVFSRGVEVVKEFVKKGVFKESQGAVIFEGSKHDLHDRVFITSKGYPTYEAKDMALAELQFKECEPDKILHVVGKEQTDYFKVIFKALEQVLPESVGKEEHLNYGWVTLKGGKMGARLGNVVLGEWLLDEVEKKIGEIMSGREFENIEDVAEKVSLAAAKYSFLKTGVHNDIKFDLDESVRVDGDSGPYLLYIVARIKSILRKKDVPQVLPSMSSVSLIEKQLLLQIARYSEVTKLSAENLDPSKIAQYLFDLAQSFNSFYAACPVLQAEDENIGNFRLQLIKKVELVMTNGLDLLGIETVDEM